MSSSSLTYRLGSVLGSGGYSVVFEAVEVNAGKVVALKKSRVSQRVKRPILQHESRIFHLLQGHPAIPAVYGYGHLPHFEYLAIELLGQDVKQICSKMAEDSKRLSVQTSARIVEQGLSVLQHIHSKRIVHRDIKPDNFLCSLREPSKILLIDFGIARPILPGPPQRYDLLKESKTIVGTLNWASLNAHKGIDLAPRDDLESLAYTAFFLLRGHLPWMSDSFISGSLKRNMILIRDSKAAFTPIPLPGEPEEFTELLTYARGLSYEQTPDYDDLRKKFGSLADRLGSSSNEPLVWSPDTESLPDLGDSHAPVVELGTEDVEEDDNVDNTDDDEEYFSDSYIGWDVADYDVQNARDKELTLPTEQEELADGAIPRIVSVLGPE